MRISDWSSDVCSSDLATGKPVSLTAFADRAVSAACAGILATHPIDTIFCFSGQMAQYLPAQAQRVIMDFVDVDSAKFAGYTDDARVPMAWMMRREARLLDRKSTRLNSSH